jgi:hypothetical protein
MTIKAMIAFAEAVRNGEEMARGLVAAVGNKQGTAAAEAIAAYAREHGYAVTREEAELFQTAARDTQGALTDEQLDAMVGEDSRADS